MNAEERQEQIVNMLKVKSPMRIEELIGQMDVTPATVRRDLSKLEREGVLNRGHGTARLSDTYPGYHLPELSESKMRIVKAAAKMVEKDMSIIFDSGSTTLALARQLANKKGIMALTSSLGIAALFAGTNVTTIMSGGTVNSNSLSLVGPDAEAFFRNVKASILFLGATGISLERGLTTFTPIHATIKSAMISAAEKVVLLADASKFKVEGAFHFADLDEIDYIITSEPIDNADMERKLEEVGTEVIVTKNRRRDKTPTLAE